MARTLICVDSSVFIDYFRKQQKQKSWLFELTNSYDFAASVITKLEIFSGVTDEQAAFWRQIFQHVRLLPLEELVIDEAIRIIKILRLQNQMIELADILIAATAITHHLPLATLNQKHFARIASVTLLLPE
ncbi:PilT protein domain protein [Candidatus Moduliflexus flocculans]|uniref:Ribonuclease VapC n=1 Tax=Candidatus Moduliflexus flocculans TaxID=1499966 RepID=A0A081BPS8_9BACT|nr:PilT protein domain protein [Candidatus Moduliflexus flocculans]